MTNSTRWYQVTRSPDGGLTFTIVDVQGADAENVVFVLARDELHAGKLAFRAYQLLDNRARRARYIAESKCPYCGRKQDRSPKQRCSVCLEAHNRNTQRHRDRVRGEVIGKPDRRTVIAENKALEVDKVRLETMRLVQRQWFAAQGDKHAFLRWLEGAIEKLAAPAATKEVA